jgi:glycopeptide antibiotics resistance protein
MRKYFSEKNALTVMVALFCLVMMIKAFFQKESLWETIGFALAFSLSIEVICHRAKERN